MINIQSAKLFNETIENNEFVVVDFWAPWCGPCRMLSSVIEEIAAEIPDILIAKVNVDEERDLALEFNIHALPTIMLFKSGKQVASKTGFMSKSAFVDFINLHK